MLADGRAGSGAIARNDVDDTRGEAGLDEELTGTERRERGLLGGLEHHGVTGGKHRRDLPGEHEEGEVPGDDLADDTNGLVKRVAAGHKYQVSNSYSLITT